MSFDCSQFVIVNSTLNSTEDYVPPSANENSNLMWILGMAFTIASSFAVSLGTVLQKKAHVDDLNKPPELRSPRKAGLLFSKMWLCGFLMMALLQIPLTFAALAMAPQSLVIPLGAGSTIVLTQMLAVCFLKEPIGRIEIIATVMIIAGVILTTTANGSGTKALTACQILNRYTETDFLAPIIVLLVLLSLSAISLHYEYACRPKFRPALFAFVAGGLGAILNIMLKVVGEFTQGAISGQEQAVLAWNSVHPYYHLVLVLFMAVGMISFINQGLERFPAVSFLPLYNCLFIILSTLLGALFFREFDVFSARAVIVFTIGVTITVLGISLISCSAQPPQKMHGIGDEDDDVIGMEMGARHRGPSDPLEHVFFDADTSMDAKAYAEAPVMSRLVLI